MEQTATQNRKLDGGLISRPVFYFRRLHQSINIKHSLIIRPMYGRGGRRGGGYGRGRRGGGRGYDWTRHIPADHPIKRMGATWNTLSFEEKERAKAEYRANPERLARQEQRAAHRREADAATLEKMGEDPAQANAFRPTAMYVQVCATASLSSESANTES